VTANGPSIRLEPRLDQDNTFFWTSGADGKLRFLRCTDCRTFVHPPAPVCPTCLGRDLAPEAVSGRATIASFTINHHAWIPGSEHYVVAWVAIDEQPDVRLTTNIVDIEENDVEIGMPVQVTFERVGEEIYLPLFTPVGSVGPAGLVGDETGAGGASK
jgi:uncharacterized protein